MKNALLLLTVFLNLRFCSGASAKAETTELGKVLASLQTLVETVKQSQKSIADKLAALHKQQRLEWAMSNAAARAFTYLDNRGEQKSSEPLLRDILLKFLNDSSRSMVECSKRISIPTSDSQDEVPDFCQTLVAAIEELTGVKPQLKRIHPDAHFYKISYR